MNQQGNPAAFFIGMLLFFGWGLFTVMLLWGSFTSNDAIGVFIHFFFALLTHSVSYMGLVVASRGFKD